MERSLVVMSALFLGGSSITIPVLAEVFGDQFPLAAAISTVFMVNALFMRNVLYVYYIGLQQPIDERNYAWICALAIGYLAVIVLATVFSGIVFFRASFIRILLVPFTATLVAFLFAISAACQAIKQDFQDFYVNPRDVYGYGLLHILAMGLYVVMVLP